MNRVVLATVALLILGAAVGVTTDRLLHRPHQQRMRLQEEVRDDPLGVMEREIGLRPDQRTRVAAILERRQGAIDSVWQDTHIRLRATIDSLASEIAAVLDPDQAQRFRTLVEQVHSTPQFPHRRH
jgi:hypothetical protein